ncbi:MULTISPECIES: TraV family lipoprotein [Sphingobium]|jgi:conjugal transfer pilus assembly protein TraV|uniref:Conjugal transfer protein TraV n=1 Tax=Sphingobium yanoikuyae TaxID=13690 RepID=A0A0J9CZF8_SPHYA|nr:MULTISPECIES: TraV family lipoprotein [Sphingobium]ATP19966.1 conjugal transfer protein TraV [Sphingobium yanoikuyae]KMW29771.1 conjugal transfer protein TraV [Sphingobium yanoikuyae]MBR2267195.1 TraV family lipoprotein [Sphingobium sp.]QCB39294.1 conjugal transfer protein TraV [Sphingobium sp. PAMC28499]
MPNQHPRGSARLSTPALLLLLGILPGCTTLGSAMSPYPEKFSCKNSDHGQCIHPEKAYADAVAGRASKSDPKVTNGSKTGESARNTDTQRTGRRSAADGYVGYRSSVYRELQGLVEAPVTPMLRPGRTIRTLILPYADRDRPERLYMPRYVYSILDKPQWVVGDYLVNPTEAAARAPILEQTKAKPTHPDSDIPAPPQDQAREQDQ